MIFLFYNKALHDLIISPVSEHPRPLMAAVPLPAGGGAAEGLLLLPDPVDGENNHYDNNIIRY